MLVDHDIALKLQIIWCPESNHFAVN